LVIRPLIAGNAKVSVFDDESTDRTGEIALQLGATVLTPEEELPKGWTGKNRACHELSLQAGAEWVVFLDADTIPSREFVSSLSAFLASRPAALKVVSGFPKMLPGRGLEPAYLGWVPWILLAANPFGLVARTGIGHGRFMNGQFTAWRLDSLREVRPFETLKGEVLEDVKIGRLLAKRKDRVEIANLSGILSVRMYWTLREAIDGMSKNSGHIGGGFLGSTAFALLLIAIGWAWMLGGRLWWAYLGLLILSKFLTDRVVKAPLWTIPFIPITALAAALTVFRSLAWIRKGTVRWKGRTYGG
jgi:glycosyltransferase involved in cell wall biosynthesis